MLSHILSLNIDCQKFSWTVVPTYIPVKNMNAPATPYLCQYLISSVCLAVTLVMGSGISWHWFVFFRLYCLIFYNPVWYFNLWCAYWSLLPRSSLGCLYLDFNWICRNLYHEYKFEWSTCIVDLFSVTCIFTVNDVFD